MESKEKFTQVPAETEMTKLQRQIDAFRAAKAAEAALLEAQKTEDKTEAIEQQTQAQIQEIEPAKTKDKETESLDVDSAIAELNEINKAIGEPEVQVFDREAFIKAELEKEKALALEREKELARAKAEAATQETSAAAPEQTPGQTPENDDPLVAINADWSHDREEMARDLAERSLNSEVAKGNILTKIWKGNLFKKYYEQKYTKEFLSNKRVDEDGKTVQELITEQSKPAMERFVLGATETMDYVHEKNGESLKRADEKTETAIREAIEKFARRSLYPGEKVKDLNRELYNDIDRAMAEAIDRGDMSKGYKRTNYLETAQKAAERYKEIAAAAKTKEEHDLAMAKVMAGFKVYNAEVRDGVRTEAHRDNIDKIINKVESSKIGRFIPPEILAGAAGAAAALTQTGARALAGAAGGVIASSLLAGLKERNRVTEDRSRMLRDAANGLEYGKNGQNKHEAKLGGTLYDMRPASELTSRIQEIMDRAKNGETGYGVDLMQAIAEARVRIDFSDSEQKDLISYSSASNRGKERLELDKILIRAERALSEKGKKDYETMRNQIKTDLIEGYEDAAGEYHEGVLDKDDEFKNYRTIAAAKKAGKTLAFGIGTFFVSQEVMAAIDPAKIGIFEKAGLLKTANNQDAQETILARALGRGTYTIRGEDQIETIANISDPEQVARYEAAGYVKTQTTPATTETRSVLSEVDPSASTARVDVRYDGWASSGTVPNNNELRTAIVNGRFVSNMSGQARFNGQTLNYDPASVKAYITVGDAKFELAGSMNEAGQMSWGEGGVFTTTTGETIKAIGDNGEKLYKYFEIAADNGVDADGIQHIIPLATDTGANTFADKISQVIEEAVESPATYTFSKVIPGASETFVRGVDTSSLAFAPNLIFGTRTGLGEASPASENPAAPEAAENFDVNAALEELAQLNRDIAAYEAQEGASESAAPNDTANASGPLPEASEEVTGASEDAPASVRAYDEAIRSHADALGETIASAMLSHEQYPDDTSDWEAAVSDLTPEQTQAIREVYTAYPRLGIDYIHYLDFGNGFRSFLAARHPDLL